MTTSEAAAKMGVSERTIRRLIKDGVVKARRKGKDWEVTQMANDLAYRKGSDRKAREYEINGLRASADGFRCSNALVSDEARRTAEKRYGGRCTLTLEEDPRLGWHWLLTHPRINRAQMWARIQQEALDTLEANGYDAEDHGPIPEEVAREAQKTAGKSARKSLFGEPKCPVS